MVNRFSLQLQYFVFMLLFFAYFIVLSVALLPVAYVVGIFDKLSHINSKATFNEKLYNSFIFFPFGIPILCFDILADMFYFWTNNFRPQSSLK